MFKKYTSIENTYREKHINYFTNKYPELKTEKYVITEKIHGANISFIFTKDGSFNVASRSRIIEDGGSFYGIWETLEKYSDLIESCKRYVGKNEVDLTLFGEYYGGKIQKGVDYGSEKKVVFFDAVVDGLYVSYKDFSNILNELDLSDLSVPVLAVVDSLEEALSYDIKFDSKILNIKNNIVEGVVIKLYDKVSVDGNGSPFYLKNKNDEFSEKKKVKKVSMEESNPELAKLHNEFLSYITEKRLEGIFSKNGEIEDPSEIGKYIKLFLNDAKDDFVKDTGFVERDYDKNVVRYIFNIGSTAAFMIKKYF